ncbi:MAG TPA: hypothetical protein VHO03_20420, partial [Ignavibacteriales bacterium]|nr:hypothetical protein [Ignavibacteriales bacterium]
MKSISSLIEEVNRITPRTETEKRLFSAVESLLEIVSVQKEMIQELRDEINRLKGEHGKPDIKPNSKPKDISSEKERKENAATPWTKHSKKEQIQIDEEIPCPIDKKILPRDAVFKGYRRLVSQDVEIRKHNKVFILEVYYSAKENRTYSSSPPPEEYTGYFGGSLKSLIVSLNAICDVTETRIVKFLEEIGISISKGSLSNILHREVDTLKEERDQILTSGIKNTDYQQVDNTGTREKGINLYTHVLCNEFFTAYYTAASKKRLS